MKTKAPALLFVLATLIGCSADDLAGPDNATDLAALESRSASVQAQDSRSVLDDFTAEPFSINGQWQASDHRGTITLFLREVSTTTRTPTAIEGKGVIHDDVHRTLTITLEGQYRGRDIEVALFDPRGETIAKGRGNFSTDRSAFKVLLVYADDSERALEFVHR